MSVRRIIDIASIIGIVASPIALGTVYLQTNVRPVVAETVEVTTRKNFPLDKAQVISFELNTNFSKLTPRQQDDQLRDWLLLTVLSGKGLNSEQLSQGAFDLPVVRYNFMNPVANFEYGATRSRSIDKDRVIALVPKASTPEQRKDYIAHIVDKHRKDQGEKPKVVELFEYNISTDKQSGSITRRQHIDGGKIFSSEYGYFETTVNSASDLQQFLAQTDDITFSEVNGASLTVGGRKVYSYKNQGLRVEDIAALWQSEKNIETRWQKFQQEQESKIKNLPYFEQEKAFKAAVAKERKNGLVGGSGFSLDWEYDYPSIQKILNEVKPQLLSLQLNGKPLVSAAELSEVSQSLVSRNSKPYLQLIEKLEDYDKSLKAKNQSIGSTTKQLNLEYDKQSQPLQAQIVQKQNELQSLIKSEQLLGVRTPESDARINQKQQEIAQLQKNLSGLYAQYRKQYDQLTQNHAKLVKFLQSRENQAFQHARYDGDLKGTEVGMVLFYTDLLAKIWSFNYNDSTPTKQIPDFIPRTKSKVSPIYKEEIEKLDYTRLWFGQQDKGFQVSDGGNELVFARNATRVYAASSSLSKPDEETTATADSEAFLSWCNDHYEEVARFEPQYARLNQIMKWSLVVNWLNQSNQGETLGFLQTIPVKRDNWFPNWARKQNNLKFQAWEKVKFFPPNYKGVTTEALPLLVSQPYEQFGEKNRYIIGGVSLASKSTFKNRTTLPIDTDFSLPARRSNINYKSILVENGQLKFDTFEGTSYKVQKISDTISETTVIPKVEAKLRSLNAQLSNQTFTSRFVQTVGRTEYSTAVGGTNLGSLNVSKTANGFRTGFQSRDIDTAYAVALDLSKSTGNSADVLANASGVKSFKYSPSKPDNYYIELQNGKWLELSSSGGGGGAKPPSKSIITVGDPEGSRSFFVKELTKKDVPDDTQGFKQVAGKTTGFSNSEPFNPRSEAQKLAENPVQYIFIQKQRLTQHINEIDNALKNGNYSQAAKLIDKSQFASHPSVKMRQALIDIHENRIKVELLTPEGAKPIENNFFDEINNREFRVVETDKDIYYVQDSPDLNNIEFKPTIAQSVSSNSGVKFYKLESGGTGGGNGGRNGNYGNVGDSGNPSNDFRGTNINYSLTNRFLNNPAAFTNDDKCQKEDDKEKENCPTEKPTYIVTK